MISLKKIKIGWNVIRRIRNWEDYFKDYLGLLKKGYTLSFKGGTKIKIRGGGTDRNIINEVWMYKVYNPAGFEIKKGDIVFDIGGHIGIFSLMASKKAEKVYVFEPLKENFDLLKENIEINKNKNIIASNKAVSDEEIFKELLVYSHNKGANSFYLDYKDFPKHRVNVKTTTLKGVLEENKVLRINFLKIDCEGEEYKILFNCPKNVLKRIDKISMEYHNLDERRNVSSMKKFLEENNFKVKVDITKSRAHGNLYARNLFFNQNP